eukprot:12366724-Karenia_brevis.AAC.1
MTINGLCWECNTMCLDFDTGYKKTESLKALASQGMTPLQLKAFADIFIVEETNKDAYQGLPRTCQLRKQQQIETMISTVPEAAGMVSWPVWHPKIASYLPPEVDSSSWSWMNMECNQMGI